MPSANFSSIVFLGMFETRKIIAVFLDNLHNTPRDDLGLAGPRTGDYLKVPIHRSYGTLLRCGVGQLNLLYDINPTTPSCTEKSGPCGPHSSCVILTIWHGTSGSPMNSVSGGTDWRPKNRRAQRFCNPAAEAGPEPGLPAQFWRGTEPLFPYAGVADSTRRQAIQGLVRFRSREIGGLADRRRQERKRSVVRRFCAARRQALCRLSSGTHPNKGETK